MRNRTSRKAARAPEWGITVGLSDGQRLYYSTRRGARGDPEWTLRLSEARRFATQAEAEDEVGPMQTNRAAKEYDVVRLPQP